MKTGIDCSLAECRSSGYAVVEHGMSELIPDRSYRLTISNPRAWTSCGKVRFNRKCGLYVFDRLFSYRDIWESFERGGRGIKDYCDFENCPYPSPDENPTFLDFASLGGTCHAYSGLS